MKKQMMLVVGLGLVLAQGVFADDSIPSAGSNATIPSTTAPSSATPQGSTNPSDTTSTNTDTNTNSTDDMNTSTSAPQPMDQ